MKSVTALVLTFNEASNIGRTLDRLSFADDIVVVDSLSSDDTCAIARRYPKVRVFERAFTTHAEQWTFGLEQTGIATEWVLALDADFVVSEALVREIDGLQPDPSVAAYRASFTYCIYGRPLRGAAYPPVTVLYRRTRARYEQDGHTQRVRVDGGVVPLVSPILHDDRKPMTHWIASQSRYMRLEAEKLRTRPSASLSAMDKLRQWVVIAPPAMVFYCLIVRGGLFDGWPGLFYACQRGLAELMLSLYLIEARLRPAGD